MSESHDQILTRVHQELIEAGTPDDLTQMPSLLVEALADTDSDLTYILAAKIVSRWYVDHFIKENL